MKDADHDYGDNIPTFFNRSAHPMGYFAYNDGLIDPHRLYWPMS